MNLTDEQRADYADLLERPQFRRFLSWLIQSAGIYDATANGSAERHFYNEGRRSLGLDALRIVEAAQPLAAPNGNPTLTLIQVLVAEAQSQSPERKPSGRRNLYNDLGPDDGSDDGNS